jgi:hypothetical protein
MALKLKDLDLKVRLPELPKSIPVYELSAPSLEERLPGLELLREHLQLGELRPVQLDHALVMAGERGEIEYFYASGGVWARDATATRETQNELRRWPSVKESGNRHDRRFVLSTETAKRLISRAKETLQTAGLIGREVDSETVDLDQVAQLDAKGKERKRGPGQATIKFNYAVEGLPVRGAGAKTLLFAEPDNGDARFTGAFHAWRTLESPRVVKMSSIEQALGVGLLVDPELVAYREAGHSIRINRLDVVYLALPAFMRQGHLFPAFQVEGEVSEGEKGPAFRFARFHHAAPPAAYVAADVYGEYVSVNPDGIAPTAPRQQKR